MFTEALAIILLPFAVSGTAGTSVRLPASLTICPGRCHVPSTSRGTCTRAVYALFVLSNDACEAIVSSIESACCRLVRAVAQSS